MRARDRILARLRATRAAVAPTPPEVRAWYALRRRQEDAPARVARLRRALEAAHAQVHDVEGTDWFELLLRIAAAKGLRNLLVGSGTQPGDALEARAAGRLQILRYEQAIDAWRDTLFASVDGALTRARSAIADTGSIVLWPDDREPRLMSLVPPIHFVLLDTATIHEDLHEAMVAERWAEGMPSNVLLVSGPSKTADIQQTLAYGAHGPRELIVLLHHRQAVPQ